MKAQGYGRTMVSGLQPGRGVKFTVAEMRCKGLSLVVKAKAKFKLKGRIKLNCEETCVSNR